MRQPGPAAVWVAWLYRPSPGGVDSRNGAGAGETRARGEACMAWCRNGIHFIFARAVPVLLSSYATILAPLLQPSEPTSFDPLPRPPPTHPPSLLHPLHLLSLPLAPHAAPSPRVYYYFQGHSRLKRHSSRPRTDSKCAPRPDMASGRRFPFGMC
ncbi:hypothetical protein DFH08DRAFT_894836, partial [Mycena albidolilacea]